MPTAPRRSKRNVSATASSIVSDVSVDSVSDSGDNYDAEGTRHDRSRSSKTNRLALPADGNSGLSGSNPSEEIPEELVETPTMTGHELAYNSRYKIFTCRRCRCGVAFKAVPVHLKSQGRFYALKEGKWKHQNIAHSCGQQLDKQLMPTIAAELNALGYHGFEAVWSKSRMTAAQPLPYQNGPIKGLHLFTGASLCVKCGDCFIQPSTFRNHRGAEHGSYANLQVPAPVVDAQSFFMAGDQQKLRLFEVKSSGSSSPKLAIQGAPKLPILEETSTPEVSVVESMRRRKAAQLKNSRTLVVKDALAQRVVLPYLQNSGIAAFLDQYEAQDLVQARILPRMTAKEAPPRLLRLRQIVLVSFIQACRKVSKATEAGRYPFGRADT